MEWLPSGKDSGIVYEDVDSFVTASDSFDATLNLLIIRDVTDDAVGYSAGPEDFFTNRGSVVLVQNLYGGTLGGQTESGTTADPGRPSSDNSHAICQPGHDWTCPVSPRYLSSSSST